MVSYAEVKNYLSKREIPQLFESLMAGLMYHRPENHITYLQTCLDEVRASADGKVQWSTFVNSRKKRSTTNLPPLTPPKKDSFSSSNGSNNSRQSTPLPPISARSRGRDVRNTYILYHNPPPVLAKPRVPVVAVLGGLGCKVDELCERVVGRMRGLVHISTCSMLKTRMIIEGFYRVTSVPACAVVDSVLQAMAMVQSANALLVAGFPRNRGDIEEYRSRHVRMDGVVLVDFEEEALRRLLHHEVSSGGMRVSEVETELERYKQDIISVAEYYDDKELLSVVMGDQETDEIVDDLVLAIDKIVESRRHVEDEEGRTSRIRCGDSPCKAIMSPVDDRPTSTVEITEEKELVESEPARTDLQNVDEVESAVESQIDDREEEETVRIDDLVKDRESPVEKSQPDEIPEIPLLFAFENIHFDFEQLQDLIVNERGMCFVDFKQLHSKDSEETFTILQGILKQDAVSYDNGFFVANFPFAILKEERLQEILKLGQVSFVCKVRESKTQSPDDEVVMEDKLFRSPFSDRIRVIFVTDDNVMDELKSSLNEIVKSRDKKSEEEPCEESAKDDGNQTADLGASEAAIDNVDETKETQGETSVPDPAEEEKTKQNATDSEHAKDIPSEANEKPEGDLEDVKQDVIVENEEETKDKDDNEDSTIRDVEDLISDDTICENVLKQSDEDKQDQNSEIVEEELQEEDDNRKDKQETQVEPNNLSVSIPQPREEEEQEPVVEEPMTRTLVRQGTFIATESKQEEEEDSKVEETPVESTEPDPAVKEENEDEAKSEKEAEDAEKESPSVKDEPPEEENEPEAIPEKLESEKEDTPKSPPPDEPANENDSNIDATLVAETSDTESKSHDKEDTQDGKGEDENAQDDPTAEPEKPESPREDAGETEKQDEEEASPAVEDNPVRAASDVQDEEKEASEVKSVPEDAKSASTNEVENADTEVVKLETQAEIHATDTEEPEKIAEPSEAPDQTEQTQEAAEDPPEPENPEINVDQTSEAKPSDKEPEIEALEVKDEDADALTDKERDSISSNRYSGKSLERGGSGMLVEGRREDEQEGDAEDQQERSSSSSRGEL